MSAIGSAAADSFIEREAGRHLFYLVHGPDEGLTHERTNAITRKILGNDDNPLNFLRLDGDIVARDPGGLADEAHSISMFGGQRVIWIDSQRQDLLGALGPLFAKPPQNCTIVVRAAQLRKDSALRQAFEKMPLTAAIECYSDEQASLGRLLDGEARTARISIAPDARAALLALLGADRETTRGEITKLLLYTMGRQSIEVEDLEAIVSGAAPSKLEHVIDRALSGDLRATALSAAQYFDEGGDAEQLMARLVAQLALLHRLCLEVDRSSSRDPARLASIAKLPVKARQMLSRQSDTWTSEAIARRLPAIQAASANVRARPELTELLATRALWALATSAAKKSAPST